MDNDNNLIDVSSVKSPDGMAIIPFYRNPTMYEISCVLFERCNLKCEFCFESHSSGEIDCEYIRSIPSLVAKSFKVEYDKYPSLRKVNVMLWGGELFIDDLVSKGMCEVYWNLVDDFRRVFKENFPRIGDITFSWLSNGVFTNRKPVEELIRHSNGMLNFSYDPIGRYSNDKQRDMMIGNSSHFFNLGLSNLVSITLTKQNIKEFIGGDCGLERLMSIGNVIDVNFYIANPGWESMQPTDDDLFDFFKWAVDNRRFNIKVIEKFFYKYVNERITRHCDCKTCSQLTFGEWSVDCARRSSTLPIWHFYGKRASEVNEGNSNDVKVSIGMHKRGCLMCKCFEVCQMPCWISVIHQGYECNSCPYERLFDYIDGDEKLISDFRRWWHEQHS